MTNGGESDSYLDDLIDENSYGFIKDQQKNKTNEPYENITSNITRYDLHDTYKVKVVDENGNPITTGKINFYVNHELASASDIDYGGFASFNLDATINTPGTYNIVSIYTSQEEEEDSIIAHESLFFSFVRTEEYTKRRLNNSTRKHRSR